MIDFPSAPTNGQIFTSGIQSWMWDGTKWLAQGVAGGIYLPLAGGILTGALNPAGGVVGVTDGSSAAPGFVGEIIQAVNTAGVALTNNTASNVATITLTPGDWDISGEVWLLPAAVASSLTAAISPVSQNWPTSPALNYGRATLNAPSLTAGQFQILTVRSVRVSLSAVSTPYYLVVVVVTGGAATGTGIISARRAR